MRVFLDANIFFAAAGSPNGGSGLIIKLGKARKFETITIPYALLEAERNIQQKLGGEALDQHYRNVAELKPKLYMLPSISAKISSYFENILISKDIPILLGAMASRSDFLITLDKRDFLENKKLQAIHFPFAILSPGDFLKQLV